MVNGKFKVKRWMWVVGALFLLLVGWFGYNWYNRDLITIKVATVVQGPIEQVVTASGIVDAPVYELSPKMGGKIMVINVREGQRVYGDQTLAEFDDTTRLVAPAGGIVAKINYDRGETVTPGMPAIVVVNYDRSWINAQIDEIDSANVRIGDRVKITSDVYPDKVFAGQIYWIAPLAELRKVGGRVKMDEESYVFPCKIAFLGNHEELKVNMSVNVDIATKKNEAALIVPREALVSKDDSSVVFVVNKFNRVKEQKLEIGIRSFSSVEAVSGVGAGDRLAVSNVTKLKDKGRVKIEK
ncbi:MAG: efflux RND transporter periplasmic adaptor subunit [Candidatus Margulisbacteria bacterium]|nr:efflux RND transporter periplasmic adaptor subunit [Candidatus Margulisiibacteriota bacterium]